jgi:hypothetical protein
MVVSWPKLMQRIVGQAVLQPVAQATPSHCYRLLAVRRFGRTIISAEDPDHLASEILPSSSRFVAAASAVAASGNGAARRQGRLGESSAMKARRSVSISSGCSRAAKCPPEIGSLQWTTW